MSTFFASGVCAFRYAGVYTVRERQNRENMMKAQATVTAVLVAIMLTVAGCGGSGGSGSAAKSVIHLADQDIDDVREAFA
jgi:hypothetical protein